MKSERWQQIDRLFDAALDLEPGARADYLDKECEGDEELQRQVEKLLAAHDKADTFIETPALEVAAEMFAVEVRTLEGRLVGPYKIKRMLGAGGMGEIYLAEDTRLGRQVALKLLPAQFTSDLSRLARFVREAKAASALNHPNIITIYDIGRDDRIHFIATEFIEGATLRQILQDGQMPVTQSLDVAIQIASALATAHSAGIIHRDIKPENVMSRPDGLIKVLDFGLVKLVEQVSIKGYDSQSGADLSTISGAIMGTPNYMSPEQARGEKIDGRTDIFSLGVLLYEMLTGVQPFRGKTAPDIIASVLMSEPLPLAKFLSKAPDELQQIVTRTLAKDRAARYQKVDELLADLKRVGRRIETEGEPGFIPENIAPPERRPGRITQLQGETVSLNEAVAFAIGQTSDSQSSESIAAPLPAGKPITRGDEQSIEIPSEKERLADEIRRFKKGVVWALVALAIILAAAAYGIFNYFSKGEKEMAAAVAPAMKIAKLTTSGKAVNAAISPDGKYVAYVHEEGRGRSIRLKDVATGNDREILAPAAAAYSGLVFSRDGTQLFFMGGDRLYRMTATGGEPKEILSNVGSKVALSPDGASFAFVRNFPALEETAVVIASADGTEVRKLISRKHPDLFRSIGPAWSPDGKAIACAVEIRSEGRHEDVLVVPVEDGSKRLLTLRWDAVGGIEWVGDGSAVVIVARDQPLNPYQIWMATFPGSQVRRVTNDLITYWELSGAIESDSLVSLQFDRLSNIWVTAPASASLMKQITSGASLDNGFWGVSWAQDQRLVYVSSETGNREIWITGAGGEGRKRLTVDGRSAYPVVSPDGRYIVFNFSRLGEPPALWRINIDGSDLKQLTGVIRESRPQFSPDGQWVFYSTKISGKHTLWKVSVEGGESVQLSERAASLPVVSPDGKFIATVFDEESAQAKIAILSIEGGQPVRLLAAPANISYLAGLRWSPDGKSLAYVATTDGISNIWSLPLDGRPMKQLTDFKSDQIFAFDWSRDGKQLACSRGVIANDVILISNFR